MPKPKVTNLPAGVELPEKFGRLREHQVEPVEQVVDALRDHDVVYLDAPTGSGKTIIAEVSRQDLGVKAIYNCTTKSLQDQVVGDFDYAKVVKGRVNYPTLDGPAWLTCDDCDKSRDGDGEWKCSWCTEVYNCPYLVAKREAAGADLAVLNTAYLLGETSNPDASVFIDRDLVIMDEADLLEQTLMDYVEFNVSPQMCKDIGVVPPKKGVHLPTIQAWVGDELIPGLKTRLARLKGRDPEVQRLARRYARLLIRARELDLVGDEGGGHWVRSYERDRGKDAAESLHMKTWRVHMFGEEVVWSKAKRWLLMSGTFLSPAHEAEWTGVDEAGRSWTTVHVPMTFDVVNRPIVYVPTQSMSRRALDEDGYAKVVDGLVEVARRHSGENILVHCVAYRHARALEAGVRGKVNHQIVSYASARERQRAINSFDWGDPVLVIAPSLDRGVDLVGDRCTVQVIAKTPYPYLGDPLVSARRGEDPMWYRAQTARTIIQSTGRAVRSDVDTATTYILDGDFGRELRSGNKMYPRWWQDALTVTPAVQFLKGK